MSAPLMTLAQVQQWLHAANSGQPMALHGAPDTAIARVHTDSRTLEPGDLFVALRGEKYDANDFLHQAKERGASALLCHRALPASQYPQGLPRIEVTDSTQALGQLAQAWRAQFTLPLIAVTGSNGKTTVTHMIATILQQHAPAGAALATQGNLNNAIGVPLTLLRLRAAHRIAVVELGMNHPGEIAYLSRLTQANVALVNNAQREHQEFMGTVEAVARENGAVLQALPQNGVAVFPSDEEFTPLWQSLIGQRNRRTFSMSAQAGTAALQADVRAALLVWQSGAWLFTLKTAEGTAPVQLHIAGRHNVKNALAASACALAAGIPLAAVVQGLLAFEPVKGRSRAWALPAKTGDITLVDDTYNANPDSVRAAIDVLAELPAPRLMVLGDMGEVGHQGPEFHAEVGAYAAECGIDMLYTLGDLSAHSAQAYGAARHFQDMDSLMDAVLQNVSDFKSLLVKGSRFMKMERVVEALRTQNKINEKKGEAHAA
jgi:UDP-N-acetylmuramoyl-tripeptide--D-alanyl-D-alanine ligase